MPFNDMVEDGGIHKVLLAMEWLSFLVMMATVLDSMMMMG